MKTVSKIFHLFFFILVLAFISCNEEERCEKNPDKIINPNGESELALMMRKMVIHAQASKDSVSDMKELPSYPEEFSTIFFAKKTDPNIDKQLFDGLAQVYLNNLKFFYKADKTDRKNAYNALIQSCAGCHQNFCSGPIKRINKLYLAKSSEK